MSSDKKNTKIKLLADEIINRIAAGEVVERPSAVLKELLENSLDAGADKIEIEIESGGKKMLRVRDNGKGMNRDDLMMSIERHATSKLTSDADLLKISTLGFRGEALPSIASVSNMRIISATEGGMGYEISVNGGVWKGLKEVAANRGTTVEVGSLFYNVPARRKFLKSEQTESAYLLDVAQSYALSRDDLSLNFLNGGREVLSVESRHDFQSRVYKVMGRQAAENLKSFEHLAAGLTISAWLGDPKRALRSSSNLFIYVLGRPVKDRLLNRAIIEGYGRLLPPKHWPSAVIFLDIDPEDVDVNVHPAKAEVRFRNPGEVFSALSEAVAKNVGGSPVINTFSAYIDSDKAVTTSILPGNNLFNLKQPEALPFEIGNYEKDEANLPPWMRDDFKQKEEEINSLSSQKLSEFKILRRSNAPSGQENFNSQESNEANFEDLRALAQLYQSYILAEGSKGLYMIDQHAAHERILFNKLKSKLMTEGLPSQALMFPDTCDLSPQLALAAGHLSEHLCRLGFDLQPFGEQSFILKSAPAILGNIDPWPALMEILSAGGSRLKSLQGAGLDEALNTMAGSWLYSLACRAAIKAGDKMSLEAMQNLIEEMAQTSNGAYCPHGRPAIQLIERRSIEKRFDR